MISYLDVPTLAHNLYNLHVSAVHDCELIPSEDGQVLYTAGIVKILFELYYCGINGEEKKNRARLKAIEWTHQSLHYHITRKWDDSELFDYSTYLSRIVKRVLIPQKPLIGREERTTPTRLIRAFHHNIKSCLFIRRFEAKANMDLPLEALEKMPEMHMTRYLTPWIERLNSRSKGEAWFWERWMGIGERIAGMDVHRVINILAERWSYNPTGMMYRLRQLDCQVFDKPDPKFIKKRDRWIHNRRIQWKGNEFLLGHQIVAYGQNGTLIFKIRAKKLFVVLSNNTTRLQLERMDHHLLWDQVKDPPLLYHEPLTSGDGFQLFRQFDHRLTTPPWKSKKYSATYRQTLIDFVWHMLRNHYTPRKLSLGSVGWIEGKLYTAESVMMDDPVHIPLMGRYIWEWTHKEPDIYRHIMKVTRLDQCLEKKFFIQVLKDIKKNNSRSLWQMAKDKDFFGNAAFERSLHWIPTHGAHFQQQAKDLADNVGADTVLSVYCEKQALGFLDPNWFSDL